MGVNLPGARRVLGRVAGGHHVGGQGLALVVLREGLVAEAEVDLVRIHYIHF